MNHLRTLFVLMLISSAISVWILVFLFRLAASIFKEFWG